MRELTKSVTSFSWAMSMFGLDQVANLFVPQSAQVGDRTAGSLEQVTQAMEGQLSDVFRRTFQAGDQFQRGVVDATFSLFPLELFDPRRWMQIGAGAAAATGRAAGEAGRSAGQAAAGALGGAQTGCGPSAPPPGWGPMPPVG